MNLDCAPPAPLHPGYAGYDNEAGKGDHCHYGDLEQPYRFVSLERLLTDFEADIRRLAGVSDGE